MHSVSIISANVVKTTVIIILLIFASLKTYGYVMGEDDRQPVDEPESLIPGVRQTGLITIPDGGFVTGLLTGRNCDVVITVGHSIVYWESNNFKGRVKGGLRGEGNLQFILDPLAGTEPVDMALVETGYQTTENLEHDIHDWAVFRLTGPASGKCKNIEILENETLCNGQVLMPAFHFDRPGTRLIDRTCRIRDSFANSIILHDCDTKDGSSGAPLFCKHNKTVKLQGINISGVTKKGYVDPGVYGKHSRSFHYKKHKNIAIPINGRFLEVLNEELQRSVARGQSR